jgi:hypothetical protein
VLEVLSIIEDLVDNETSCSSKRGEGGCRSEEEQGDVPGVGR